MLRATLLCLSCAACAGTPRGPGTAPPPPPYGARQALPAGTIVLLEPIRVLGGAARPDLDALLAQGLGQTGHLDLAWGTTAVVRDHRIEVTFEPGSRTLTAVLHTGSGPAVPLAAEAPLSTPPHAGIDRLALHVRQALGEEVDAAPLGSAAGASRDLAAVRDAVAGSRALGRGDARRALQAFRSARRRDGGSPLVLDGLAAARLLAGDPQGAEQDALEALEYRHRLSPVVTHRLTRTLLLARASRGQGHNTGPDTQLLKFAQVCRRERPHDVEPKISEALALNFLGRFTEAAPLLRTLAERLPHHGLIHYHRAYAAVALDRPREALDALEAVGDQLPAEFLVLPRALALFQAGEHETLRRELDALMEDRRIRESVVLHEVARMRASLALLTGRQGDAVRILLDDLEWLRRRPTVLGERALHLTEEGEVLVRLGAYRELDVLLRGFKDLGQLPAPVADGLVFLMGLVQVQATGNRALMAEATLESRRGELEAWGNVVKAYGHRARGELAEEASALARAALYSNRPLVKAALARAWQGMGRTAQARAMRAALRAEMGAIHLRRPSQHPLLHPGNALAWILPK